MSMWLRCGSLLTIAAIVAPPPSLAQTAQSQQSSATAPLAGYSAQSSADERATEKSFRDGIIAANIRDNMQRLSARPHNVGSPYDKDNAEWMLARFKEWGFDAHIETFNVLFPTPKERVVELIAPTQYKAKLQEPALAIDPTSNQTAEQLPTYNAYSIDGDVTAPLVYVNYGNREDYEQLDRLGISVKGAVVKPDTDANTSVYGKSVNAEALLKQGSIPPPPIFKPFMMELDKYSKK